MPPPLDPHKDCPLHFAGPRLDQARLVVLAAHGRYGVAADILKHAKPVGMADVTWIAPQAADRSWWGASFLAPLADNEPGLASACARLTAITEDLASRGFGPDRIVLVGFSQGACLMLEHLARNPMPWRGVVAMSGGLLGTSDGDGGTCDALLGHAPKNFDYDSDLAGIPINIGCHDADPVIPIARVQHSADVLRELGADVTVNVCPGKMHGVLPSDLKALRRFLTD